ncbi:MAG: hypothetical protein GF398_07635 [Chitinivibrionales bacterium]|nr:hypothetical protein [Chitinivibrionales bacterium]
MKKALFLFFIIGLIASALVFVLYKSALLPVHLLPETRKSKTRTSQADIPQASASLPFENILTKAFTELEVTSENIERRTSDDSSQIHYRIKVPQGRSAEFIVWKLTTAARSSLYRVDDCLCSPGANSSCKLTYKSRSPARPHISVSFSFSDTYLSRIAQVAFVIDDFSFQANQTTIDILSFPEPLTVSLLPLKKRSEWTAQIFEEYSKEIVILLPLESKTRRTTDSLYSFIKVHYSEFQIRKLFNKFTDAIPACKGFSHYRGSRALNDSRVMSIILAEVKKRNAYFLLDQEAAGNISMSIAGKLELPVDQIDLSVSPDLTRKEIGETLRIIITRAQKSGSLLIKAKSHADFIATLLEYLPYFKRYGVSLVFASQLCKSSG